MTKKTMQENQTLIAFWDKAFALSEEDQKQMLEGGGSDWKEIAPSEKLYQAVCSLGKRNKVLDYGCGRSPRGCPGRPALCHALRRRGSCACCLF